MPMARLSFCDSPQPGAMPMRAQSPHVPLSHAEIVSDIQRCIELGVQMVHLHARDGQGVQTSEPEPYARLIEAIRALPGGEDLVIGVTTSGRLDPSFDARCRVLDSLSAIATPE